MNKTLPQSYKIRFQVNRDMVTWNIMCILTRLVPFTDGSKISEHKQWEAEGPSHDFLDIVLSFVGYISVLGTRTDWHIETSVPVSSFIKQSMYPGALSSVEVLCHTWNLCSATIEFSRWPSLLHLRYFSHLVSVILPICHTVSGTSHIWSVILPICHTYTLLHSQDAIYSYTCDF